ncbi:amidotransferase 1, exosortase A system-associated [Motiliproteus coralliicola]|uniref:asparagine synthase (glutamine-hydrolyzing) n=1 Tax=Motiliproteus coralliicola TaxID=2283196 RepID=A0A369WZ55_9GAMM|nr:XrtA/PEP-CTERM system amidotransferase [Motiliproteus coralliicola]RDE24795.1 amidotransferase 1, exosortase A system-associated [Motiliproteus coralliicola]
MCGIAGIFHRQPGVEINRELLARMNTIQSHRGPDDDGYHFDDSIGLAHRRLSIIDLAGGHQPIYNETGSVSVVFNGEIYNFAELAEELTELGHQFKTRSDTETIVHAWEQWGPDCVTRFRGMFAFAIWDNDKKQLFLARDRLGIKPLFYSQLSTGELIFGSELKVLTQHPLCPRAINNHSVEDYFALGYVPEPKTIYQGVNKLEPGHTLLVQHGDLPLQPQRYWDIPMDQTPVSETDIKEQLVERLKEAVDIRLISEVPLGAFLSGGVDSSAVVALMAQLQDDPVNTCSIGFDVPEFNETDFAQTVADRYQTNHHVKTVSSNDFGLIDKLSELYDEPYADSSAMPTYRVCQLARERVTVALSGDGGDELLAGYRRYNWHLKEESFRQKLPLGLRRPLFGTLGRVYPKLDWAPRYLRGKTTFQSMSYDWIEGYLNSMSILRADERRRLFNDQFKRDLNGYTALEVFRHHAATCPTDHPLSQVQYLDMKTYLVGDILTKVDRASMAHSLEVRVPILDHKFVEWAAGISPEQRLQGSEGKAVFKQAMEPHLPQDVLYRKKMGFAVPLCDWFRGPLKQKLESSLLSEHMLDSGLFNPDTLRWLVRSHLNGTRDNSASLWTSLMFERFLNREAN